MVEDDDLDVGLAWAWAALDEVILLVGSMFSFKPVACCKSFPCSVMSAGASFLSCCRS